MRAGRPIKEQKMSRHLTKSQQNDHKRTKIYIKNTRNQTNKNHNGENKTEAEE